VSRDVDKLPVPSWAFEALGQPVEKRLFRYEDMIYPGGRGSNQWGAGASIPDVSRSETKLWFYFLARSYMDAGCEAIHYGQVELMNGNDLKLDAGVGTCGKEGQSVPVGVGQPTLRVDALTVGGTA